MKYIFLLMSLVLLSRPSWSNPLSEVILPVGGSQKISVPAAGSVKVSPKNVVLIEDLGAQLKVMGLKMGAAQVRTRQSLVQIHILDKQTYRLFKKMSDLFKDFLGLKLGVQNGQIVVRGELYRFSDWLAVAQEAESFAAHFLFQAQMSDQIKKEALAHFNTLLEKANLPQPKFSLQNQVQIFLPMDSKKLEDEWSRLFLPFGFQIKYSESLLPQNPMIQVKVHIAELSQKAHQTLGIDWSSVQNSLVLPINTGNPPLQVALKAMESQGTGQLLAQPQLLCQSGNEAQFHSGGEFPIKLMNYKTKDVIWKRHGILLNIKPKADTSKQINIQIDAEISLLDMGNAVDGVPALKKNRVQTHFNVQNGQTIILSGLLQNQWGDSAEGLPYLLRLPILGKLFSSQSFLHKKSELVIFVTPSLISNHQNTKIKNPKDWKKYD